MTIEEILFYLDKHEIDYRLESNFCCGYIFYFLDGLCYPRRYYDTQLEGEPDELLAESVNHLIQRATSFELKKDWVHRIEGNDLADTFKQVEEYLKTKKGNNHE